MTERSQDEKRSDEDDQKSAEPDLRSIMGVPGSRRRTVHTEPTEERDQPRPTDERDVEAPPYVPPVREGDEFDRTRRERAAEEEVPPYEPPVREGDERPRDDNKRSSTVNDESLEDRDKLPPVWPGDENQPWFRRERGLPPLPESKGEEVKVSPDEFPTELADIPVRGRAFGVTVLLPNAVGLLLGIFGSVIATVMLVINLYLFRQGQDIGAALFGLRVVRQNGDVAGFFQMFVRNAASSISLILLGAGFWGAFSDPERRTWHDKWLGTYVVKDSPEYKTRRRSSSNIAFNWFWIIILLTIGVFVLFWLSDPIAIETMPTPEAGDGPADGGGAGDGSGGASESGAGEGGTGDSA